MDFIKIFIEAGFTNGKWLIRYINFINRFNNQYVDGFHNHHILPRSLFKEYKSFIKCPENNSKLSYRAHLIAHYILAKAIGGTMWFAYNNMNAHNVRLSTRLYESGQKEISIEQSKRAKKWLSENPHPKGMKGKTHTIETKKRFSEIGKNRVCSDEIKQKLSKNWKTKSDDEKITINTKISQHKIGSVHSNETKKIISDKALKRYEEGFKYEKTDEDLKKQKESLKKFYEENDHHTKGKSYEEIMGKEKAEKLKKLRSENNPMKNKESRDKISRKHKGKIVTDETKTKLSILIPITDGVKNKRISPELLSAFLENGWLRGSTQKPEQKFKCIHCGKETIKGNLKRWHNDNCKFKVIES